MNHQLEVWLFGRAKRELEPRIKSAIEQIIAEFPAVAYIRYKFAADHSGDESCFFKIVLNRPFPEDRDGRNRLYAIESNLRKNSDFDDYPFYPYFNYRTVAECKVIGENLEPEWRPACTP